MAFFLERGAGRVQNPRELHMAQWSQGLPLGSTVHCFSFSKNSTSSETAASATPNLSWLGWAGVCESDAMSFSFARKNGASQGDCATWGTKLVVGSKFCGLASVWAPIDGRVAGGGAAEMKLIRRAPGSRSGRSPLCQPGSLRSRAVGSPASLRATRSAINRAGSCLVFTAVTQTVRLLTQAGSLR